MLNRRSLFKASGYFSAAALVSPWLTSARQLKSRAAESPVMTMQLDWVFNVQFAGLLLAEHQGLYRQKGLTLTIKPWESGMIVPEVVAANPMMIGCSEQNLILDAQAQGIPLKAIATMFQASPYALMTMPNRGLTQLTDLVGKKVGVHADGVKVMELVKGVSGLAPTDIEVVEIPYDNKLDRLISGELDALQCYAVDEPIGFRQKVGEAPVLMPMDQYGYKAYAQVFFTTDSMLQQAPEQVKAFLEASFAGWELALADIPGTARLVAETYAAPGSKYTNVDYQQQSLQLVGEYVLRGINPDQMGMILPEQWQQTADLMAQYGIIAQAPSGADSLDLSLWTPA
ncbi:MAG: ABC transporter substrate-binding protein [Elainella sp. Prado103]|jgi:ABC-type nitrate/sulfonate/bicarbonate transport system substrate-binding protein|nr:ABC transporter substrate-binding protein [Elainella sp. Prado103]